MLVSPLLVFQSYQMDFEPRLFYGLLQTLFVSFVTFLVCIILAEIFMKGIRHGSRSKNDCDLF